MTTHMTISHIVSDGTKHFGFASSDDGQTEFFIPRSVILHCNMTAEDVGAGFTAPARARLDASDDRNSHKHVILPVTWDSDGAPDPVAADFLVNVESICDRIDAVTRQLLEDRSNLVTEAAAIRRWLSRVRTSPPSPEV